MVSQSMGILSRLMEGLFKNLNRVYQNSELFYTFFDALADYFTS